jgi:hypothetical protein
MMFMVMLCLVGTLGQAEENEPMLVNTGFEDVSPANKALPDYWSFFSTDEPGAKLRDGDAYQGERCLEMEAPEDAKPHDFYGVMQRVPIEGNERYDVEAYVRNNKDNPLKGAVYGQLVVEWVDESNKEISRVYSKRWTRSYTRGKWKRIKMRHKAPKKAVLAVVSVQLHQGGTGGKGSFSVDDFTMNQH